jgi:photosystem II stability/assembly factor-like uncharacterized protein
MLSRLFFSIIILCNCTSILNAQQWIEINPSLGAVSDIDVLGDKYYTISNLGDFGFSEDNFESWTVKNIYDVATIFNPIFTSIAFFDENHGIVAIRNLSLENQILETTDGGQSWAVLEVDYDVNCGLNYIPIDLDKINDSMAILSPLNSNEYKITSDKGMAWACYPFDHPSSIQNRIIRSENEWIFNGSAGLFKTINAGLTWNSIIEKDFAHFHQGYNNELYGITWYYNESDQVPVLYVSTDDFQTYNSIPLSQFEGEYIDMFVYESDENIFVIVNGEDVYHSSDGAQNFNYIQTLSRNTLKMDLMNGKWLLFGRGLWELDLTASSTELNSINSSDLIYPNPTSSIINITDLDFNAFELFDLSGKLIKSGSIQNQQINVQFEDAAVYLLKLESDDKVLFKKVIKID